MKHTYDLLREIGSEVCRNLPGTAERPAEIVAAVDPNVLDEVEFRTRVGDRAGVVRVDVRMPRAFDHVASYLALALTRENHGPTYTLEDDAAYLRARGLGSIAERLEALAALQEARIEEATSRIEGVDSLLESMAQSAEKLGSRTGEYVEGYLVSHGDPEGHEAAVLLDDAAKMIRELLDQNSSLSAGQCVVEGGLIGDEGGSPRCTMRDEVEKLRVQLAGCAVVARSPDDPVKEGDYGWSRALEDVREVARKAVRFGDALRLARIELLAIRSKVEAGEKVVAPVDVIDKTERALGITRERQ